MPGDLKYVELVRWLHSATLSVPVHSHELDLIGRQFEANIRRTAYLAICPAALVPMAKVAQLRRDIAAEVLFGKVTIDDPNVDLVARDAALAEQIQKIAPGFEEQVIEPMRGEPREVAGATAVETYSTWDLSTPDALRGLMAAVIIGAWTAIETVTADLWVACLNARPRLGFIAIDAEPAAGDDQATADRKVLARCPVPVWMFRETALDLNKNMGNILREQRKWDFGNRGRAADAYFKVFGKDDPKLTAVLESEELQWLAATRNALVHKAGIADREFKKLVRRHPTLSKVEEQKPIPVDGELTADFFKSL